ncbi:MAG: nucleotidyltransferase domain-containing protein [Candidatus Brockarchaeota archaeon]|nr:nucleotidyltransferase domain-containing protein [Candidatus Brockarchaeota archaeon]
MERYKEALVRELKPDRIILYGSFARGDVNEGSDVDLIVITDWKEDPLERIGKLLELNKFNIPIEPLGYTEEEFERLIEERNPFILQVLDEGKVIYQAERRGR